MFLKPLQETREHAPSYYAATANWQTNYPTLQGHTTADVCIVGGGFSGVATAVELAEKGYKVVLIEANRISWGATGRNGGQIIGGLGRDVEQFENVIGEEGVKAIYKMGFEGVEILKERIAKYNINCDLKNGYMDVALKARHVKEFIEFKEWLELEGYAYPLRLLSAEETQEIVKSKNYCGGLLNENGQGHIHPLNLCIGEARAAEQLGARIFEQSRVQKIVHGDKPTVHTEQGSVQANYVVLCGNAYLENLVPSLASRVLPCSSFIIATEPLGARTQEILTKDVAVCDPRAALDYFRLSSDGRLLFGGMANYTGLAPRDVTGSMYQKMLAVFPQLKNVRIDYTWGGQMDIGLNRMPQLGRMNNNVYYVQGYSGHGVAPTHMMGKVLADAIAGNAERFDIFAKIKHWPFPGGKLLRRPGLALGMLYYRLKDAL